jgi:hypothetical protein
LSSGLAQLLLEKSPLLQPSEEELFAAHDRLFAKGGKVKKFGLGGDVEGGADQGVGGMQNDGQQSNGTESNSSSFGEAMGNTSNGGFGGFGGTTGGNYDSGRDYNGDSAGADVSGGISGNYSGGYDGGGWGDSGGYDPAGDVGFGDLPGGMMGGNAFASDSFGGQGSGSAAVGDGPMGYSDADFGGSGLGGVASTAMSDSFAPTESGYRDAQNGDFGTIGTAPLAGSMEDFGPGVFGGALSAGLNPSSLQGLGALASITTPSVPEYEDAPPVFTADVPIPPENPVRAMARMAATENMQNYEKNGVRSLQGPMEVAMNRAATNHLGYGTDVYDQIMAPSQFSGMNKKGEINTTAIKNADSFLASHPEVYGLAADLYTGALPGTMTKGAINLDGPDKYSRTGKDYVDLGGQRAWSKDDTALQAAQALAGVLPESAPVPPAAPERPATAIATQPYEDDEALPAVGYGIVGPQSAITPEQSWGDYLGSMFGMSAQASPAITAPTAGKFTDRNPDLENQQAYGPQVSVPSLADLSGIGPVNGVPISTEKPGLIESIARALRDEPAVAQPAMPSATTLATMEQAFPSFNDPFGYSNPSRSMMSLGPSPSRGPMMAGLPGFVDEDTGLPSGFANSRMSVEPRVAESFPNYSTPSQLGPGVQVAGAGVPTGTTASPASARSASPATSAPSPARGVATGDIYGPVQPGMIPGTATYPETGVIGQPSTWAHEKIAEKVGPALGGMIPGLGIASMASGLFGGPTLSGLFANSSPGMNLGLGSNFVTQGEGYRDAPHQSKDDKPTVETKAMESTVPLKSKSTKSKYAFDDERYLGPPKDPKHYGYGSERRYFERTS